MSFVWNFLTGVTKDVRHVIQNEDTPRPGDMIQFQMPFFQHWGIYVGDGEVVHFALPEIGMGTFLNPNLSNLLMRKYEITKVKMKDVQGAMKSAVWNKFDRVYPPLDANRVVNRALHMVGRVMKYDPFQANCEHFATLMRYGIARSEQAERFNITVDPDFEGAVRRYLRLMEVVNVSTSFRGRFL